MRTSSLAAVALLAGCVGFPPRVAVAPSGNALSLAPRTPDCAVEFYRTRPPERAYDEVATLHLQGAGDAAAAQEAMRAHACDLGADAVVVTRDFVPATMGSTSFMTGTAVSFRDARDQHRVAAALRAAEEARITAQLEEERKAAVASGKPGAAAAPPGSFVRARARTSVSVRGAPERTAPEVELVPGGADVWVAPQPSAGWRRVWVPGGTTGWVEDGQVERLSPSPGAASPAPDPAPGSAPPPDPGTTSI